MLYGIVDVHFSFFFFFFFFLFLFFSATILSGPYLWNSYSQRLQIECAAWSCGLVLHYCLPFNSLRYFFLFFFFFFFAKILSGSYLWNRYSQRLQIECAAWFCGLVLHYCLPSNLLRNFLFFYFFFCSATILSGPYLWNRYSQRLQIECAAWFCGLVLHYCLPSNLLHNFLFFYFFFYSATILSGPYLWNRYSQRLQIECAAWFCGLVLHYCLPSNLLRNFLFFYFFFCSATILSGPYLWNRYSQRLQIECAAWFCGLVLHYCLPSNLLHNFLFFYFFFYSATILSGPYLWNRYSQRLQIECAAWSCGLILHCYLPSNSLRYWTKVRGIAPRSHTGRPRTCLVDVSNFINIDVSILFLKASERMTYLF